MEKKFRHFVTDCFDSTNLKLNYLEQELSYHGENKLFILHKKMKFSTENFFSSSL